jgi:hypothetical protein
MAIIDEVKQKIIFNQVEKEAAWNNAPKLENLSPAKFRLCYFCKFRIDKSLPIEKTTAENQALGWIVDLINAKELNFALDNLIVIHEVCLAYHQKLDQTKTLKKVKSLLWKYNE